jgi:hypothetical protein
MTRDEAQASLELFNRGLIQLTSASEVYGRNCIEGTQLAQDGKEKIGNLVHALSMTYANLLEQALRLQYERDSLLNTFIMPRSEAKG